MPRPSNAASERDLPSPWVVGVAGWLVPGAGHGLVGDLRKAAVFFGTLLAMFVIGIAAGGRLFPLQSGEPLVLFAALAEWLLGLPRLVAGVAGFGEGRVVVPSYEYGNTFLIAGGLLNALVLLDAFDVASGRKRR